jgi:hypothetical protein
LPLIKNFVLPAVAVSAANTTVGSVASTMHR